MVARQEPVGLALAGGLSRRFGSDKAALELGGPDGETLLERAVQRLAAVCPEVAIADRGRHRLAGVPSLSDGAGAGPAAALLGGARTYPGRPLLALACDLPEVSPEMLAALLEMEGDWVVPRWQGQLEPLCALYRPAALEALAAAVDAGRFALHRLAETLSTGYLEGNALLRFGAPERLFLNLNTPEDLTRWRAQFSQGTSELPGGGQRPQGQSRRR